MSMEIQWVTMYPTEQDFDFWIKNRYNVLFIGGHGVGKTAMITEAFKKNKLNHRYFSASTMDPWVDFIGVPKEAQDEHGLYLDLVKPKEFRDDAVEALFFDEYNRAPSKVRNAVMELIQFKSINGRKFNNLNVVWAAINDGVEGVGYDTEGLDYAQLDRFHVIVKIPSKPNTKHFVQNHGKAGEVVCKWWDQLPNDLKAFISPRRCDILLDIFKNGGNIEYSLPSNANAKLLIRNLKEGLPYDKLRALIARNDQNELSDWLRKEANTSQVLNELIAKHLDSCFELLTQEKQTQLVSLHKEVKNFVSKNPDKFSDLISNIRCSKDKNLRKWATEIEIPSDKKRKDALGDFVDWQPGRSINRLHTEVEAKYGAMTWDKVKIDNCAGSKLAPGSTENTALATALRAVKPDDKYYSTTENKAKVLRILDALKDKKVISDDQVEIVIWALNRWTFGMQSYTLHSLFKKEDYAIFIDVLSRYIQMKKRFSESPRSLFVALQYIYVLYRESSYDLVFKK